MASFYGRHWIDLWAGVPMQEVLNEWEKTLTGMPGGAVQKALDHCKEKNKFPPTLPEFVQLCKSYMPQQFNHAITKKLSDEELEENQRRIQQASKDMARMPGRDYKKWAKDILRDVEKGIHYPDISIRFAKEALGMEL